MSELLIAIDQIEVTFHVRKGVHSHEVVETLLAMDLAGTQFPAIILYDKKKNPTLPQGRDPKAVYGVVEGRNRYQVKKLQWVNGNLPPSIKAEVRDYTKEYGKSAYAMMMRDAITANVGGPQPPLTADLSHSVLQMLERGMPYSQIRTLLLPHFQPKYLKNFLDRAKSTANKRRKERTIQRSIREHIDLEKSWEMEGGDPKEFQETFAEPKRKIKNSQELKSGMNARAKHYNQENKKIFDYVLDTVRDGLLPYPEGVEVARRSLQLAHNILMKARDFEARLLELREAVAHA